MKKRRLLAVLLILGATAAILFTFAGMRPSDEKVEVKVQYLTQNVLNPLEGEPFEVLLEEKDKICNIAVMVEWMHPERFLTLGGGCISEYEVFFIDSDGNRDRFGKRNIMYYSTGAVMMSDTIEQETPNEIFFKAFPRISYRSLPRKSSVNVGTFLCGSWKSGDFIIIAKVSTFRSAILWEIPCWEPDRVIGQIEARVHVGEGVGLPEEARFIKKFEVNSNEKAQ